MKTYYLIYVYRGEIKIRECRRCQLNSRLFEPVNSIGYYKYTNIPESPKILQHGKIYCETKGDIPDCISKIKVHYKDRILLLEKSIRYGKLVLEGEVKNG
jgi:hypothetical protein